MAGIDHALLRSLTQTPMDAETWAEHLRLHGEFLDTVQGVHWGSWTILDVSGLPLAVWQGPTGKAGKQLNLNLANLCGLALEWAVLSASAMPGVMAAGTSFRGVEFKRSCLTDAALDRADFSLAKLEHTDFSRASLRGASFRKALVLDTDFEGCDLREADFRGAQIRDASFSGARLEGALGLLAN